MKNQARVWALVWLGVVAGLGSAAQGAYLPVYGWLPYDSATSTGYQGNWSSAVNNLGVALGYSQRYVSGVNMGARAVRWNASGTATAELNNLGTDPSGVPTAYGMAINDTGTGTGWSEKYAGGADLGSRAVRWDAGGTVATELGVLGTDPSGKTNAWARKINASGTVVGTVDKYLNSISVGQRAVRWDAGGTAATELGHLGTNSAGLTTAEAFAVNNAGTAVGHATVFLGDSALGTRAVRWAAGGTVATELGHLGTDPNGVTGASARAINASGTAVGFADKYTGGIGVGTRAVRWDTGGTVATGLDSLGTDPSEWTSAGARAINDTGTIVGYSRKYVGGTLLGDRAVRWAAGGTAATELGIIGTDPSGTSEADAYAINSSGIAVGYAMQYVGMDGDMRAVYWGADGVAVNLNDLIDPNSGWVLRQACDISDTGWITGIGTFTPHGPIFVAYEDTASAQVSYDRMFLIQIPEPGTLVLLALSGLAVLRRRRGYHMCTQRGRQIGI